MSVDAGLLGLVDFVGYPVSLGGLNVGGGSAVAGKRYRALLLQAMLDAERRTLKKSVLSELKQESRKEGMFEAIAQTEFNRLNKLWTTSVYATIAAEV